jgi:hypothetical protein
MRRKFPIEASDRTAAPLAGAASTIRGEAPRSASRPRPGHGLFRPDANGFAECSPRAQIDTMPAILSFDENADETLDSYAECCRHLSAALPGSTRLRSIGEAVRAGSGDISLSKPYGIWRRPPLWWWQPNDARQAAHRTECPNRPAKFAVGPSISRLPHREQISHLRIHS